MQEGVPGARASEQHQLRRIERHRPEAGPRPTLRREDKGREERSLERDATGPGWPDASRALAALSRLDIESARSEIESLVRLLAPCAEEQPLATRLFLYDLLRSVGHSISLEGGTPPEARRFAWMALLSESDSRDETFAAFLSEVERLLGPYRANQRLLNPIVLRARRFIDEHASETISLSRVASELGVARNYLSALFKRETGLTLTEYIHRVRIRRAELLLRTGDRTLAEVAYQIGYQSYRHFYRNFVRICGKAPTLYVRSLGPDEVGAGGRDQPAH